MRILILDQSDSAGAGLADLEDAWPRRMARELERTTFGRPEVIDLWLHARPGVGAYVRRRLDEHRPDVVILVLSAHLFVSQGISSHLQQRLPRGLYAAYGAALRLFKAGAERAGSSGRLVDRTLRRQARRLLRVRPSMGAEEVSSAYAEVIHELARREDLLVVVSGGTSYARHLQRELPGLAAAIARFNAGLRLLVERHHMRWLDLEEAMSRGGARESC